jgi:hypothetical protein
MSTLNGPQYEALVDALVDAFPSDTALAMMLKFRLDKALAAIVGPGSLRDQAFYLIQASEAEGWTSDLVDAARKSRPRNPRLLEVAQAIQSPATHVPGGPELERIIKDTNRFHDIGEWREKMAAIELQVCRITVRSNKGNMFGTGFLVAPDAVLTNHHVIEAVILGEQGQATAKGRSARATDVVCQFDFKKVAGYLDAGVSVALATDWLIDSSPVSPVDLMADPGGAQPDPSHLDYALLRLARKVGAEPVKGDRERAESGADLRGWIRVPTGAAEFEPKTPIFIVQHPDGAPLSFALDTAGLIGLNGNGTRVRYRTNTLGGSSGSPCFDQDWQLVALHHSGDPNFDPLHKPAYNEGIPVSAIRAALRARGLEGEFDHPLPT